MISSRKWDAIQPKCTIHVDGPSRQWALYLTNSPEDELRMIGLDPARRDALHNKKNDPSPEVRAGMSLAYYHTEYNRRDYFTKDLIDVRPACISTSILSTHSIIYQIWCNKTGRIWITFGGRKAITRIKWLFHDNNVPIFVNKDGTDNPKNPLENWRKDTYRNELHECEDSVGLDVVHMVMTSAAGEKPPPADDEDWIAQD